MHEHTALFELFRTRDADRRAGRRALRLASRVPAGRGARASTGIRAIPWGFGWTQIRLMLTGWLGAGTALADDDEHAGRGSSACARMARDWPFFDDLLGKIEMVCAKTDLEIARTYVRAARRRHGAAGRCSRRSSAARWTRCCDPRHAAAADATTPVLQSAIGLRNPYVDPLSLLQIALLDEEASLAGRRQPEREKVDGVLATTLSGIAQGLRNTG